MKLDKIKWKINFKNADKVNLDDAFKVFAGWIENSKEVFVDVATYKHVSNGPKVVLIGYQCEYWLDQSDGKLGFLYGSRHAPEGDSAESRLKNSLLEFINTAEKFISLPEFHNKAEYDLSSIQFIVNDRLDAPNNEDSYAQIKKQITDLFNKHELTFDYLVNERELVMLSIAFKNKITLLDLKVV